jgi:hypothetical protein
MEGRGAVFLYVNSWLNMDTAIPLWYVHFSRKRGRKFYFTQIIIGRFHAVPFIDKPIL